MNSMKYNNGNKDDIAVDWKTELQENHRFFSASLF